MKPHLKIETHPLANPENIVQGDCYRITVLTPSMVRLEYSPEGHFTDEATQSILNRDFPRVDFTYRDTEGELEIRTDYFQLIKKNFPLKDFPVSPSRWRRRALPGGTGRRGVTGKRCRR